MRIPYRFNCFFLAAIASCLILKVAMAASVSEIAKIARQTTVKINGKQSSGSGVLVANQSGNFWVLTCRHIVENTNEQYKIRTPDGQQYQAISSQIKRFNPVNLALIPFASSNGYSAAVIANSNNLAEGDPIYVSGFPVSTNSQNVDLDEFQFTNGIVSSRLNSPRKEGYGIYHTSLTYAGMGGSPMFNRNGQLVGLHCGGDRDRDYPEVKTGFNWGIPINTFTQLAHQMKMYLKFANNTDDPREDLDNLSSPSSPFQDRKSTEDELLF